MERILEIYEKALAGTATEEEMKLLRSWMAEQENTVLARELIENSFLRTAATVDMPEEKARAIFQAIVTADKRTRVFTMGRWAAAAAIALLLAGGVSYYWWQPKHAVVVQPTAIADISPAHKGAILTLSDGSQLVLDSVKNRQISQNGARILLDSGQLTYDPTANTSSDLTYNAIQTPKGRQFNLQLPDGTLVWLNAASSIRYPTIFNGKERMVEVTGEAYFEVAQNSKMPFKVNINKQALVEVLGTSFNINAYGDNGSINTTLIDGAIAVKHTPKQGAAATKPVIIKPGQAAQITIDHEMNDANTITVIQHADINKALAWKNGAFNLEGASLKEVMKEVERWYDIQVVYENGVVPDIYFTGEMSRNVKLSSFLKALKEWQINYRLENNRLIILP